MGAQWIHGQQGNAVYELVKNRDLNMEIAMFDGVLFVQSSGAVLNSKINQFLLNVSFESLEFNISIVSDKDALSKFTNDGDYYNYK